MHYKGIEYQSKYIVCEMIMKPELFNSLKGYKAKYLWNDIMAGLLVAIIAMPLSIALGLDSGATLQQGLMTAIVAGFFVAAVGGSRFQIGGPTAAFAVIIASYIADPEIGFIGVQIATICAGALLIFMGLTRMGKFIRYIPFPIVVGYTTSVGVTLMVGQLKNFFGIIANNGYEYLNFSNFLNKMAVIVGNITTFNYMTFLMGMLTLVLIIFLPKITKKLPATFIAIIIVTVINVLIDKFSGYNFNVATIGSTYGDIKAEFNFINFKGISNIKWIKLIAPAFIIAFLCSIESLLTATVADTITKTRHNSNQELLGQGVANIASAMCCGLPATGALARTAANINSGAKSSLAGIFHAIFLLIMYVVLLPVVKYIPLASMGAVLIVVAYSMSNFKLFFRLTSFTKRDTAVLMVTFILTVVFDLAYGVIGGLIVMIAVSIPNFIHPAKLVIAQSEDIVGQEKYTEENCKFFIVTHDISFNSINGIIQRIIKESKDCELIVLDMSNTKRIDVTSVEKLVKCVKYLSEVDRRLVIHNANARIEKRYRKAFLHIVKRS